MKKKYLIFIIIFFSGCKTTDKRNINIETISVSTDKNVSLNYDCYVSESILIPLDKGNNQYLSSIKRFYVKNNKIAVISEDKVFIYNSENGRLLFFLDRKGKGPGEYMNIDDIYLDSETLYILDKYNRAIMKYNLQGKFIKKIDTGLVGFTFTRINPDVFAIYINSNISDKSRYRLNLYSLRKGEIVKKFFRISDSEYRWQYVLDSRNFIKNKGHTYFIQSFNDTVYNIREEGIHPSYYVDFGKNRTPSDFLKKDYEDIREFSIKASRKNYIYSIVGFHHTIDYVYFAYRLNNECIHCIYSLKTGRTVSFNNFENYLNIKGLNEKTSWSNFPLTNDDEYFYAVIEPNSFKEKIKGKKVSYPDWINPVLHSDKEDNPFVLKFKLDNFKNIIQK